MSYQRLNGDDADGFDIEAALKRQDARLAALQETAEKQLFWRRIATGAAVVGGLMALTKLSDIWRAVKTRRARI